MALVFGAKAQAQDIHLPLSSMEWKVGDLVEKDKYKSIALYSMSLEDNESVDIRKCFNDTTHIFSFGRDSNRNLLVIHLLCFLGEYCSGGEGKSGGSGNESQSGMKDLKRLREDYEEKRVYKSSATPAQIVIGDMLDINGFITSMTLGNVSPDNGTAVVTLRILPILKN